jgi:hypothetical protein
VDGVTPLGLLGQEGAGAAKACLTVANPAAHPRALKAAAEAGLKIKVKTGD